MVDAWNGNLPCPSRASFEKRCIAAADRNVEVVCTRKPFQRAVGTHAEVSLLSVAKKEKRRIFVEIRVTREIHLCDQTCRRAKDREVNMFGPPATDVRASKISAWIDCVERVVTIAVRDGPTNSEKVRIQRLDCRIITVRIASPFVRVPDFDKRVPDRAPALIGKSPRDFDPVAFGKRATWRDAAQVVFTMARGRQGCDERNKGLTCGLRNEEQGGLHKRSSS